MQEHFRNGCPEAGVTESKFGTDLLKRCRRRLRHPTLRNLWERLAWAMGGENGPICLAEVDGNSAPSGADSNSHLSSRAEQVFGSCLVTSHGEMAWCGIRAGHTGPLKPPPIANAPCRPPQTHTHTHTQDFGTPRGPVLPSSVRFRRNQGRKMGQDASSGGRAALLVKIAPSLVEIAHNTRT